MKCRICVVVEPTVYPRLFSDAATEALSALGEVVFRETDDRLTEDRLADLARGCDVMVTGWHMPRLTFAIADLLPELKLIAHSGVSVRTFIDESLLHAGVRVTNAGDAMTVPVAEFTLMQVLRALRFRTTEVPGTEEGGWSVYGLQAGFELAGCAVGVVGAGRIGRRVIQLLRAFGADVLVHDPLFSEADAAAIGVSTVGLDGLLRASRIVTLHAPDVPAARGMIGADELAAMPDGAWLINTARASLVDGDALMRELQCGRISAALDVFDDEPLPGDSPLRTLPNVLLTAHSAFLTCECLKRLGDAAVAEVRRFVLGEPLRNEVTADMLKTTA